MPRHDLRHWIASFDLHFRPGNPTDPFDRLGGDEQGLWESSWAQIAVTLAIWAAIGVIVGLALSKSIGIVRGVLGGLAAGLGVASLQMLRKIILLLRQVRSLFDTTVVHSLDIGGWQNEPVYKTSTSRPVLKQAVFKGFLDSLDFPDQTSGALKIIRSKGDLLHLGPPTISIQGMQLSEALEEQREERF